jgi:hypothetical protein
MGIKSGKMQSELLVELESSLALLYGPKISLAWTWLEAAIFMFARRNVFAELAIDSESAALVIIVQPNSYDLTSTSPALLES